MPKVRLNFFIIFLFGVFVFLQYRLWVEKGGVPDIMHTKNTLMTQDEQLEHLQKENKKLLTQIDRLKSSKDATESRARNELGMIKEGETFYQIVK